jgi:AraC-like DNA-binding protein
VCTRVGDGRHHVSHTEEFLAARSDFFSDLEVFARARHANSCSIHLHDRWQLTWILSGAVDLFHRGGSHILHAGDAVLAAPFEPIGGRRYNAQPFGFVTLQIPADLLRAIDNPCVVARHGGGALCHELMSRLMSARTGAEQGAALDDLARAFTSFATHNVVLTPARTRVHPAIKRACALLDESLEEKLRLIELAQAIRMNHRYVISLFRGAMGVSPHQYVMARRIERARKLLNDGHALNTVAAEIGFNDQSHLTHHFKRTFGVTPGAYQARHCHMNFLQNFPLPAA